MALYKIYQEKSGQFRALLKLNKRIEFVSVGLNSKYACYKLIKKVRKASQLKTSYVKTTSDCGSVCFKLIDASTSEELGESMLYINDEVLNSKIEILKKELVVAKLDAEMYSI